MAFLTRIMLKPTSYRKCLINCVNMASITNPENHSVNIPSIVGTIKEDLSEATPYMPATFNIAAYVNNSETLKNFVKMDVDISKIEKKPHLFEKFLKFDFERDVKHKIIYLNNYVDSNAIVNLISKNPMIFKESINDIEVRINYLELKRFSKDQIKSILSRNPFWLMFSTNRIDRRLGHFQDQFKLTGKEVRFLAVKQPRIITYNLHHIKTNTFVIKEEMGFQDHEVKLLLLGKPRMWMMNQNSLLRRFQYLHNTMKIPHDVLLEHPDIFEFRNFKIKQRHMFLEKLGRAQFDPKKENYVPLMALAGMTDTEFCSKYAKCSVTDFNLYLKTL